MPAKDKPQLSVVHLAHTGERGGAELALARLLKASGRGWAATLIMPRGEKGVFAGVAARDAAIVQVGRVQPPGASKSGLGGAISFGWRILKQAIGVRRTAALRAADVVHANSTRAAVYGVLVVLGTKKPLVVHLRDRMEPDAIGRFGYLAFRRLVMPRATGFIANSASTADVIRPMMKDGQFIEIVPSPYGMERAIARRSERGNPIRIGIVARLDPWKGQQMLVEAFARAGLDDRAELVLIGDAAFGHEAYERELREAVAAHSLQNVRFAGFQNDVQSAIDELDICVQYSSRPEPLGQNVLQYLARGKLTVVAGEGGPLEWVTDGENGLVVPPRDVEALATTLRRAVDDEHLRESIAGRALTDPTFPSEKDIIEKHAQAFARAKDGRK